MWPWGHGSMCTWGLGLCGHEGYGLCECGWHDLDRPLIGDAKWNVENLVYNNRLRHIMSIDCWCNSGLKLQTRRKGLQQTKRSKSVFLLGSSIASASVGHRGTVRERCCHTPRKELPWDFYSLLGIIPPTYRSNMVTWTVCSARISTPLNKRKSSCTATVKILDDAG